MLKSTQGYATMVRNLKKLLKKSIMGKLLNFPALSTDLYKQTKGKKFRENYSLNIKTFDSAYSLSGARNMIVVIFVLKHVVTLQLF